MQLIQDSDKVKHYVTCAECKKGQLDGSYVSTAPTPPIRGIIFGHTFICDQCITKAASLLNQPEKLTK
jgi:hypothetical protein